MLKKFFSFCIGSIFFICPMVADSKATSKSLVVLRNEIDKVLSQLGKEAQVSVQIAYVKDGFVIYEKNPKQRLTPSSSVKLLTGAAILNELGPGYVFETKLLTDGSFQDDRLLGNLFLQGVGDPSLKGRSLENLIFQLRLMGIKEVQGDLVFDATEFDELTLAPGWMWDDEVGYKNSPVDALTINHSCLKVWVKPSFDLKVAPFVGIQPEMPGITIENIAKMGKIDVSKGTLVVSKKGLVEKDAILVSGIMSDQSEMLKIKIPVRNPQLYVATEFKEGLRKNGITHKGKIRFEAVPIGCQTLATHFSEPLFKLVMYMIKNSNDLYANCFFKKLGGVVHGKPGTWPNGSQSIKDFLMGVNKEVFSDIALLDGSGDSSFNLASSEQMVKFLTWMSRDFIYSPELMAALPLSGIDQTFRKRMRDKFLKAKVRADSGSLKGVSSLSGYVVTHDGDPLAFSIIINNYEGELKNDIEDRVCYILAHFSKEPLSHAKSS